ncbi:MAG TPA: class I SAM-dependent RNA methyltransferase [Candidatus Binataceae bacterium]
MPEVEITAMTFGPFGVGRLDGKAVMVPNAAPGDRVEVAMVSERRDYAIAKISTILKPGPERRTPPCPFLPRCGGCDWQHLEYSAQLRLKGELIGAELSRALDLKLNAERLVEPAPDEFGYRSRVRLKAGAGGALGYYELGSNALVAIDRCAVAEPELHPPTEFARALGGRLDEVEVAGAGERIVVVGHLKRPPAQPELALARQVLASDRTIAGIILRAGRVRELLGDTEVELDIEDGLAIRADADLFSQVNRAQNRKLVAAVMESAALGEHTAVLDLFCGTGNFSLPAARRGARVTGVDADRFAIAAAARNAERLALDDAQFVAMKAGAIAEFLQRARYRSEVVILDPPRTGALALMEPIAKLRPRTIIYVSCDVTTLARDLRALVAHRYAIRAVSAFDFFPNTHHAEIVARAVLT